MSRYCYFARTLGHSRYSDLNFIRVASSDPRFPELTKNYNNIGLHACFSYPYTPTKEEEVFQLRKWLRAWDCNVTVAGIDEKGAKELR